MLIPLAAALAAVAVPPMDGFVVQPYYVYPADQQMHKEYVDAIKKLVVEVQDWYKQKVGLTFRLEPLLVRKGDNYVNMRGGPQPDGKVVTKRDEMPYWWTALESATGGWKKKTVTWVFAQGGGGYAGANLIGDWQGIATFGDWVLEPISGVREPAAIHSGYATWQVQGGVPKGTTVHELGHAFGLHHPDGYEGKSIMKWHGDYPAVGLRPHEILNLRNSPWFAKDAFDADAPWLDFENADVMKWGEKVTLKGKGFKDGDMVKFVWMATETSAYSAENERFACTKAVVLSETEVQVTVPMGIGPGHIRIQRGQLRGNAVPVNFQKP